MINGVRAENANCQSSEECGSGAFTGDMAQSKRETPTASMFFTLNRFLLLEGDEASSIPGYPPKYESWNTT